MKRTSLIIISLFCINFLFSQNENADAIYEKLVKEYTLEAEGITSYREYKQLHLLTHLSFNRLYGETFIIYNPDFQKLKINEAYTIMADSSKVITPPNAFNEVLPRNAALSATANHMKEMVVTHTATEIGATIFLDYTLTSAKGFLPGLMGNLLIQESSPVNAMEVRVKIPSDLELTYQMVGLRTAPEISIVGNQKVFTWKFSGLAASPKEPYQGKYQPSATRLLFTTAIGIAESINWITNQTAFDLKINEEMKTWVDSIRSHEVDEIKTLMAIQKAVVENVVYERYDPAWMAYRSRTPEQVWNSNGGNKLEKSLLLASLLKQASFNAVPVLVGSKPFFNEKAINLSAFDDVLLMVNTKGFGTIYISAIGTDNQTLEHDLWSSILIPLIKGTSRAPVEISQPDNKIAFNGTFTFSDDLKPSGLMELELSGSANPFLLLQNDKVGFKSLVTGGLVKDADAIELENSNLVKSEFAVKAETDKPVTDQNGYFRWNLPQLTNGFEKWQISYLDRERISDFYLSGPITESYTYTITVPAGYELINKRFSERVKCAAGSASVEMKPKDNQIEIIRELNLTETTISQQDYQEFREMINFWLDKNQKALVFRKAEK